jgi:Protein of unknown function (DUF3046)
VGTLARVRLTEFWQRMDDELGASYAPVWASLTVLSELGGRTVDEALAQGEETKTVWRAVVAHLGLPVSRR